MTTLPVREMVLYKHGVGFFVRQGSIEANNATLTFRQSEVSDPTLTVTSLVRRNTTGVIAAQKYHGRPNATNARSSPTSPRSALGSSVMSHAGIDQNATTTTPIHTARRVRDVGSLNGTYLNRERIEDAALSNGDELQIGKFRLVFFASSERDG